MPIVIKELFPADPLSQVLEKINFNFDQLLLAGGGPPGPIGLLGPQGIPGPIGPRGSLWDVGSTATVGYTAQTFDQVLDNPTGDVFEYDGTDWNFTGLNLIGPQGIPGVTGGSSEFLLWRGASGASADSLQWSPQLPIGPTSIDGLFTDFYIPRRSDKNVLFLGDETWAYEQLSNLTPSSDIPPGGTVSDLVPKLTVIQKRVTAAGSGGLAIGVYGLTGGTAANPADLTTGDINAPVDANDFFYAGFAVVPEGVSSKQVFRAKSNTLDFEIQAGAGVTPTNKIKLKSSQVQIWNHNALDQFANISSTGTWIRDKIFIGGTTPASGSDNLIVIGSARITTTPAAPSPATVFLTRGVGGQLQTRTSAQVLSDIGGVGGALSGITDSVAYWGSPSSIDADANFVWLTSSSRLGVGTSAPANTVSIIGRLSVGNNVSLTGDDIAEFGGSSSGTNTGVTINLRSNDDAPSGRSEVIKIMRSDGGVKGILGFVESHMVIHSGALGLSSGINLSTNSLDPTSGSKMSIANNGRVRIAQNAISGSGSSRLNVVGNVQIGGDGAGPTNGLSVVGRSDLNVHKRVNTFIVNLNSVAVGATSNVFAINLAAQINDDFALASLTRNAIRITLDVGMSKRTINSTPPYPSAYQRINCFVILDGTGTITELVKVGSFTTNGNIYLASNDFNPSGTNVCDVFLDAGNLVLRYTNGPAQISMEFSTTITYQIIEAGAGLLEPTQEAPGGK